MSEFAPYVLMLGHRSLLMFIYLMAVLCWLPWSAMEPWAVVVHALHAVAYALAGLLWLYGWQWRRLAQYSAWVPLFSFPAVIVLLLLTPAWQYLGLLMLTLALFVVAGWASFVRQPEIGGIPAARASWPLSLKVAFDESMLGYFVTTSRMPGPKRVPVIAGEVHEAVELMQKRGWLADPASYHVTPVAPVNFEIEQKTARGWDYQALRFRTAHIPDPQMPGRERWSGYEATHTVRARIFEHADGPRPWLMCIHGYRMGRPFLDFQLFSPRWLHYRLGFNLVMPLLPLHGHRKEGLRSGDGFFEGELLNLLHAEAQAVSDLRAIILWLREHREVPKLGVYGISLGGLNASLLACLEADIDSLVAGIPLVDPARVFELNAPTRLLRHFERQGVGVDMIRQLLTPISPLRMPCRVPAGNRAIIAGSQDRILPLEPILRLQEHWEGCPLHWYAGSHLSIRRESRVRDWLLAIWQENGMIAVAQTRPQVSPGVVGGD